MNGIGSMTFGNSIVESGSEGESRFILLKRPVFNFITPDHDCKTQVSVLSTQYSSGTSYNVPRQFRVLDSSIISI